MTDYPHTEILTKVVLFVNKNAVEEKGLSFCDKLVNFNFILSSYTNRALWGRKKDSRGQGVKDRGAE
jgi:hypothetical protein